MSGFYKNVKYPIRMCACRYRLTNDKSKIIAGGALTTKLDSIENVEAVGERLVHETGEVRYSSYVRNIEGPDGWSYTYRYWDDWEDYSDSSKSAIDLKISELGGNRNLAGTGTQISAVQNNVTISDTAANIGTIKSGVGEVDVSRGIIEVPALSVSGTAAGVNSHRGDMSLSDAAVIDRQAAVTGQALNGEDISTADRKLGNVLAPNEIIRTLMPSVRLPSNSLFQVHPEPTATYLIETDPRFTDQRQWVNSDYLLDTLQADPATTHKRLGDGFYEQRLIREQVTQLTGQRFLEGYADDQAQYAALMNNAATFAKEHDLRPGVALTAEQMAQLTSDMVWLVEQTVTLEDGSQVKVLVPQVYARLREGDLKGDGTLIAGDSLQLDVAGDVINSGTLAGRELVEMTADNLTNLEGRISGNRVDLETRRDLTNLGGEIIANESLRIQAGRDLNLASTSERLAGLYVADSDGQLLAGAGRDLTIRGAEIDSTGSLRLNAGRDLDIASTLDAESKRYGRRTLGSAELERQATLNAGQDLILNAGRDLDLTAIDVTAGGDGQITAGRDLSLTTLITGNELRQGSDTMRSRQQEVGTRLEFGNDLTLLAGQDLQARATEMSAEGNMGIFAGRDIEIEAGQSSRYEERRTRRTHTIDSQRRVLGSEFTAGGDLSLSAGDDLRLTASRLQAGDEASLIASGDIELLTAQEQDYSLYEEKSGGGLFSSKRYQRDEVNDIRAVGSEIASGGDLTLTSGADQRYQAARLEAGDDLRLSSGGTIRFETASDIRTESHEREKSNFAWQSSSGEGFTRETLRQSELMAQGEQVIEAVERLYVEVPKIDRQTVSQTIDAMAEADPDHAWLQEMDERGDIDWQRVKAIHDSWDYEQSGLGGGVAMVVAVVAAATGQYYAMMALEGVVAGAAAAAIGAGAGSMAGTAAVSVINNRGDLGATFDDTFSSDSLRGAAIAAVSAGATKGVMGETTNTATGATTGLDLSKAGDIARFAGQRATQAAIDAGVRTAIDGGSLSDNFEDSLEGALAHVVSGVLFNAVGDQAWDKGWEEGSPEKIALHALVGGSVTEAMGGDFKTGALAAGASEALVDRLVENARENPILSNTVALLVGIVAAEFAGGDVSDGALIAGQVESYNRQLHSPERDLARELAERDGQYTADEIEQALRGMYHDGLGESTGSNVTVDLYDLNVIDDSYYDYGGEWLATPGGDGTTRYLVQMVPTDTPPELIAYLIEQTGGEDSPYRAPVYRLPAEEAAPGQPHDRLTGRPLNEAGQYTVSYVVDGKVFHVPHFSCGDAACIAEGANIDYSDPAAQAYSRVLNAKALEDIGDLATYALMISPGGAVGATLAYSSTAANLYAGYLQDELPSSVSKEVLTFGFEKYAVARGVPAQLATRMSTAFDAAGIWDRVIENGASMLRVEDEK